MTITRTNGGYWIVRYKGVTYYTFTKNLLVALTMAYGMDGKQVAY